MIEKIKKIFLVFGVLLFILTFTSCSNNDTDSFFHVDYFYEKDDNYLSNNKVTIGIGNSIFDENNNKVLSIDDDYYLGIKNICISVYIGSNQTPIEQIEIESEDFFSSKYTVNTKDKKITVDDYSKTYEFSLSDYEIIDYIKFVVTYDWFYQNGETHHTKSLYLYGQFIDGQFYITKEKTKHFG